MKEIKIYKIQDSKTGLFSTGGVCPRFTKSGKIWSRLNFVMSHLTLVGHCNIPDTWNLVEYNFNGAVTITQIVKLLKEKGKTK